MRERRWRIFSAPLLLDLPIAGDLRRRGHRRGDLDLRPLHSRELIRSLACGNPLIVRLHEILLGAFKGVGRLIQRTFATRIRLTRIVGGRLARHRASAVLHRVAFMLGEKRWIRRGHRQRKEDTGDGRNSANYEFHTPTPLNK